MTGIMMSEMTARNCPPSSLASASRPFSAVATSKPDRRSTRARPSRTSWLSSTSKTPMAGSLMATPQLPGACRGAADRRGGNPPRSRPHGRPRRGPTTQPAGRRLGPRNRGVTLGGRGSPRLVLPARWPSPLSTWPRSRPSPRRTPVPRESLRRARRGGLPPAPAPGGGAGPPTALAKGREHQRRDGEGHDERHDHRGRAPAWSRYPAVRAGGGAGQYLPGAAATLGQRTALPLHEAELGKQGEGGALTE